MPSALLHGGAERVVALRAEQNLGFAAAASTSLSSAEVDAHWTERRSLFITKGGRCLVSRLGIMSIADSHHQSLDVLWNSVASVAEYGNAAAFSLLLYR